MKVKLALTTIDTSKIKQLHNKYKRLHSGLGGTIRPHYSIELDDGSFIVITKQEYKLLSKILKGSDK